MTTKPSRPWLTITLAIAAVAGWVFAMVVMFGSQRSSRTSSGDGWGHPQAEAEHDHATDEGPPVIRLSDLPPLGFDSASLVQIEPHFHVLNAALITLVELHENILEGDTHDGAGSASHNAVGQSVEFHITADRHERMIETILPENLREKFHEYILATESKIGLHPDTVWHNHSAPRSRDPLPLFRHPERADTAHTVTRPARDAMTSEPP